METGYPDEIIVDVEYSYLTGLFADFFEETQGVPYWPPGTLIGKSITLSPADVTQRSELADASRCWLEAYKVPKVGEGWRGQMRFRVALTTKPIAKTPNPPPFLFLGQGLVDLSKVVGLQAKHGPVGPRAPESHVSVR